MQLSFELIEPSVSAKACVIWLHGLGASGHDFVDAPSIMQHCQSEAVRFIFPHAPEQPVTINGGMRMPAWYDIVSTDFAFREDKMGVAASAKSIQALIDEQNRQGIPNARIALIGFSQGGAMSLHVGSGQATPLGAIAALSAYLPCHEDFASHVKLAAKSTPIWMGHGEQDPVVPFSIGQASAEHLKAVGFPLEWHAFTMEHNVCIEELTLLDKWLHKNLLTK